VGQKLLFYILQYVNENAVLEIQ